MTPPLVQGGQGRSERECRESAGCIVIYALLAFAALVAAVIWGRP